MTRRLQDVATTCLVTCGKNIANANEASSTAIAMHYHFRSGSSLDQSGQSLLLKLSLEFCPIYPRAKAVYHLLSSQILLSVMGSSCEIYRDCIDISRAGFFSSVDGNPGMAGFTGQSPDGSRKSRRIWGCR